MDEAVARNKAEADGTELQYGVHYSAPKRYGFRKGDDGLERYIIGEEDSEEEESDE